MSVTTAHDLKVEGNNCGFWLRQADPCTQSIHISTVIIAALSAIALLGGVLFILAQQGYQLGGINFLVKNIHPIAIYATVAVSTTVLVLDIAFICALIHGYTNQVLSQKEIEDLQLLPNLKATQINLTPLHYSYYISPENLEVTDEKGRPAVYAIVVKDESGQVSVVPFKTEELLNSHISRLENLNYMPMKEVGFGDRINITSENIHQLVNDPSWLERKCACLAKGLPEGFFTFERVTLIKDGEQQYVTLFAVKQEAMSKVEHFIIMFLSESDLKVFGIKYLQGCVNI